MLNKTAKTGDWWHVCPQIWNAMLYLLFWIYG